jgi:hypothetical protein
VVAPLGIIAVAIDGAIVHGAFAIVAYAMISRRKSQNPISALWEDIGPATVCCAAMAAAAVPVDRLAAAAQVGGAGRFAAVFATSAVVYLMTLRLAFGASWRDLSALIRRVVPTGVIYHRVRSLRLAGSRSM